MKVRRRDSGAAAVEFALIVPVFLALIFGIISYGVMLNMRQNLSQAAADGARIYAVSVRNTPAEIQTLAREAITHSLQTYGLECRTGGTLVKKSGATTTNVGTCTVPTPVTCTGGQCVTVSIVYNYRSNPLVPSFPGLGITLPEQLKYTTTVVVNS